MSFIPEIVQASLTLQERIAGTRGIFFPWAKPEPAAVKRWERWREMVGDEERLNHRLSWAKLGNRGFVYSVLAGKQTIDVPTPSWTVILEEATQAVDRSPSLPYLTAEPVPFEDLMVPFIEVALQRLSLPPHWSDIASPGVLPVLARQLLGWLVNLSGRAWLEQFSLFRLAEQPMMARLIMHLPNYQSNELYRQFVAKQKTDRLETFWRTYPVLARLMSRVTELWLEATQEFINRLQGDYEVLLKFFGVTGRVESVQPELGDPHNGGRTVAAVEFSSGQKIVYKPRSLKAEQAFNTWVSWVNGLGGLLDLPMVPVLDRGDYGWMAFVVSQPCQDRAAVGRFYQRLGQLLALLYILGGNDCHYENLIAQGEYPVLVDLETLMHHEFRDTIPPELRQGSEALYLAQTYLQRSVIQVGLLPRWEGSGKQTIDLSGMGMGGEQEVAQVPKWEDINRDKMRVEQAPLYAKAEGSSPRLNDQPVHPAEFTPEFVQGFRNLWTTIEGYREQAPLDSLKGLTLRTIYRPTQTYANILEATLRPPYLRHGLDFSIELERLARPLLWMKQVHPLFPLVEAETRALLQYDMPLFRSASDSTHLWEGKHNSAPLLPNCFIQPSLETVRQNLQNLTPQQLEEQVSLIETSLYASGLSSDSLARSFSLTWQEVPPVSPQQAIDRAVAIGAELAQRAFYGKDGSVAWIGLGLLPNSDKFRLQPVEYCLYDGAMGIGLFLAALYQETQTDRWRKLALGAIQPLEFLLNNQAMLPLFVNGVGIGGAAGLGSIVYGFTKIAQFLGDNSFLLIADRVAQLITPAVIAQDTLYDVVGGSAGAILALLSLYRVTGKAHLLDRAIACGEHLLAKRTPTSTGHLAWQSSDLPHLTGFSHGAAGIAYALLELYRATQGQPFLEAAQGGIAFEEAVFLETEQNYPDFRSPGQVSCMNSWCHGAAGIALARLGSLQTLDNTDLRTAIDRAVATTQQAGCQPIDHLCCGNLGRLETLLTAVQVLDRPDLIPIVQKQLSNLIHRAEARGGFYLFPDKNLFNPGFFQGLSGIGYALLRLAKPDRYPNVLLWQ
jgi:type 2 lantibiotic biosynthesis protein LanM